MREADGLFLYQPAIAGGGGLLGGFPPDKKTGPTGPVFMYKLLPWVGFLMRLMFDLAHHSALRVITASC